MARILVVGERSGVAGRSLLERLARRLRDLGQDAAVYGQTGEAPVRCVGDCDGVVAVLDAPGAETAAAVAYAHARQKPVLGLALPESAVPPFLAEASRLHRGADEEAWAAALPDFCDRVRPFAGRLVRDQVPALVREAGYELTFRSLAEEERPRFLKQKVAAEAAELERADLAREKEEVADVLEALEAFLRARGFDRDDLRRVKEAKRKRRGGFERCFVVEATAASAQAEANEAAHEVANDEAHEVDEAGTPGSEPPAPDGPGQANGIDYEFPEHDDEPVARIDTVAPNKTVQSNFFEL